MTNLFPRPDATYGVGMPWQATYGLNVASNGIDYSAPAPNGASDVVRVYYGHPSNVEFPVTVTPGTLYTLSFEWMVEGPDAANAGAYMQVVFTGYSSNVSSPWVQTTTVGAYKKSSMTFTPPSGMTSIQVRFYSRTAAGYLPAGNALRFRNIYVGQYVPVDGSEPTPPVPSPTPDSGLDIRLEVGEKQAGANLITNPHGDPTPFGWIPSNPSYAQVSTVSQPPLTFIRGTALSAQSTYFQSEMFDVTPNLYAGIRLRWGGYSKDARVGVSFDWYNASNTYLSSTGVVVVNPASSNEYQKVPGQTPSTAYKARVRITLYRWTGNNDKPFAGDFIEWREATVTESTVIGDVDDYAAWQADTSMTWTDIIGPSHEITIDRVAMDGGYLNATVLHEDYDPAMGGLIKPGRFVRVSARKSDNSWERLYTGTIRKVNVTYPRNEETRIFLSATDNMYVLNSQKENRGAQTIDELPYLIDGVGVPWNINGNQSTVSTLADAPVSDNASLLDQILVTRDTDKAYAWIDRNNVFRAITRPDSAGTPVVEFSDTPNAASNYASYNNPDVSFSTDACINMVEIILLTTEAGETVETRYGPYTDDASISEWGAYKSTFTIHAPNAWYGAAQWYRDFLLQDFADSVMSANAQPVVRMNSLVMPVKDAKSRTHAAQIDLYDVVGVKYADKVDADIRVTGIKHEIRPDIWLTEYSFEKADSVAVPLVVPSAGGSSA